MILLRGYRFLVIAIQSFGQHINAPTPLGIELVRRKAAVLVFML